MAQEVDGLARLHRAQAALLPPTTSFARTLPAAAIQSPFPSSPHAAPSRPELLSYDVHAKEKLAHYAQACTDIAFEFPFGKQDSAAPTPSIPPPRASHPACARCQPRRPLSTRTAAATGAASARGIHARGDDEGVVRRGKVDLQEEGLVLRSTSQELQGCAARGNYDLTQHEAASGKSMECAIGLRHRHGARTGPGLGHGVRGALRPVHAAHKHVAAAAAAGTLTTSSRKSTSRTSSSPRLASTG